MFVFSQIWYHSTRFLTQTKPIECYIGKAEVILLCTISLDVLNWGLIKVTSQCRIKVARGHKLKIHLKKVNNFYIINHVTIHVTAIMHAEFCKYKKTGSRWIATA